MIHSDHLQGKPEEDSVSQTFTDDDLVTSRQTIKSTSNDTTTGTIRRSQMVFATDIAQGLITEVRKLQQTIQEKDRLIKDLEINKADDEKDKALTQKQLRQKNALEEKLKEDNWNLEVANQDLQIELSELNQSITKLNTEHSRAMKQLRASLEQIEIYKAQQEKATSTMDVLKARHDHEQQLLRHNTGNLKRDVVQLKKRLDEVNTELKICKSKLAIRSTIDNNSNHHKRGDNYDSALGTGDHTLGAIDDDLSGPNASHPDTNNASSLTSANSQQRALEVETLKQSLGHALRMISSLRNNLQKEKVEKIELRKVLVDTQESMEKLQQGATANVDSTGGHGYLKKSSVASRTKMVRKRGGMPRKGSPEIMETPAAYMENDQLGSLALDTTLELKNYTGNNIQLAMDNNDAESVDDDISMDDISSVDQGEGGAEDDEDDDHDDDCHRLDLSPIAQGQSLDFELQLGGFTSSFEPISSDKGQTVAERQYFDKGVNTCGDMATERQIAPDMLDSTNASSTSINIGNEKDATNTDLSSKIISAPTMHLDQQSQSISSYPQTALDSKHSPIPSSDVTPQGLQQMNLLPQSQSPDTRDGPSTTFQEGTITPLPGSPLHTQQQQQQQHSTSGTTSNTIALTDQFDAETHKSANIIDTPATMKTVDDSFSPDQYLANTTHASNNLLAIADGDNSSSSTLKANQRTHEVQQEPITLTLHQNESSLMTSISDESPMYEKTIQSYSANEYRSKGTDHVLETVHSLASKGTDDQAIDIGTNGPTDKPAIIKDVVSRVKDCDDISSSSGLNSRLPELMIDTTFETSGANGILRAMDSTLRHDIDMDTTVDADKENVNDDIFTMDSTTNMISRDEADALIKAGIADALAKERLEAAARRSEMDINFVTRSEAEAMARAQTDQVLKKERNRTSTMLTKAQADTLAKKYVEQVLLEEEEKDQSQRKSQELMSKLPPTPATSSFLAKAKVASSRQNHTPLANNSTTGTISRRTSHASLAPTPKPSTSTSSTTTSVSSTSRLGIFSGFRKLQPSISTPAKSARLRPSASTSSLRRTTTATSNSSQQTSGLPCHYQHQQQQFNQHGEVDQHLQPPSSATAASYGTVRITETSTYSRKPSIASLKQHQQRLKQPSMQSLSSSVEKGGGMAPSVFSMGDLSKRNDSGDLISAITQTMIGEWMWKHTRKHVGSGISVNKHKRFFWVHPYTRTLYWSTNEPGMDADEAKAKSAFIESISSIPSNDTVDSSPLSLLIKTAKRDLKLTAPTLERHELWRMSLSYLLVPPGEESGMGDVIQVDPYHESDAGTISPTTHATVDDDTRTMRTTASQHQHHIGHYDDGVNKDRFSVTSASDEDDSDDSLDAVINVRQCCDDHDVATLSRH